VAEGIVIGLIIIIHTDHLIGVHITIHGVILLLALATTAIIVAIVGGNVAVVV
jgi:hypothetical protein